MITEERPKELDRHLLNFDNALLKIKTLRDGIRDTIGVNLSSLNRSIEELEIVRCGLEPAYFEYCVHNLPKIGEPVFLQLMMGEDSATVTLTIERVVEPPKNMKGRVINFLKKIC